MGRILSIIALVIVAAVAAIVIVPSLIDWNAFRAPIEHEASRLAGREVTIKGNIELGLLPSPHIDLSDIAIADPAAPTTPLLTAGRLAASAAWLPLFVGRIEITQLGLIEPIIRIRINRSGTLNWSLADKRYAGAGAAFGFGTLGAETESFADRGFAMLASAMAAPGRLRFRDVWVERGTLLFNDVRNGGASEVDKITGRFSVAGTGTMTGQSAFILDNQSLTAALSLAPVVAGRPTLATMTLTFLANNATLTLEGSASGLDKAWRARSPAPIAFLGKLDLAGAGSAPVIAGLSAIARFDFPPAEKGALVGSSRLRSLPLRLAGTFEFGKGSFALANAEGTLGKTKAAIEIARTASDPHLKVKIAAGVLYLDEIIDFTPTPGMHFAPIGAVSSPMQTLSACHCTGEVTLTAPRVELGSGDLDDLDVDLVLQKDGAVLQRAHIVLPGNSPLDVTGAFSAVAKPNGHVFDGTTAFKSETPRALLSWLGFSTDHIDPNVFKSLGLDGPISLIDAQASAESGLRGTTAEHYIVPEIDGAKLALDNQIYQLTASYDDRAPGRLLLHVAGDWLDADAYGLTGLWLPSASLDAAQWARTLWAHAARAEAIDVAVKLGALRLARHSINGFSAVLDRTPGGPATAQVEIADLAGYQVAFDGTRAHAAALTPPDIDAKLVISGNGRPIHLPLAGKGLPGSLALTATLDQSGGQANYALDGTIGSIKLKGTGTGPASSALIPDMESLNVAGQFSNGTSELSGSFRELTSAPTLNASLTIDAVDFPAFMRELGFSYEPRRTNLGPFSLVSQFTAGGARIDVASLAASVGDDNLTGTGSLAFGKRAVLTADIKIGKASLEGYLPAPDPASSWSTERLKLDLLRRFDGAVHLTADKFVIGPYDLRQLSTGFTIKDSMVTTESARANLYGGALALDGSASIEDDGVHGAFRGTLSSYDWVAASRKLFPALGVSGAGRADSTFAVTAAGRSLFDLASSFAGTLAVSGSNGTVNEFDLAAWAGGLAGANRGADLARLAKSALGQGATPLRSFKIAGRASQGTIRLSQGDLVFDTGEGELSGSVDLPSRSLDLKLAVEPAGQSALPAAIIETSGPIAKPQRSFDLKNLAAAPKSAPAS